MDDEPLITAVEDDLRRVCAAADPVPQALLRAAVESFTWRTIDADLAMLVFDSAGDQREAVLSRGCQQPRMLMFHAADLAVEVEISPVGQAYQLVGRLVPPQRARVELRHGGGTRTVVADDLGRFAVDGVGTGPVSLRLRLPGAGPDVVTDWTTL